MTLELERPLVFLEGLQIAFEKPESSLRIDSVNAGRSKAHYSTLLLPYDLLRVFYVTPRLGKIVNFSAHCESLVYKERQRIRYAPQLCITPTEENGRVRALHHQDDLGAFDAHLAVACLPPKIRQTRPWAPASVASGVQRTTWASAAGQQSGLFSRGT